MKMSAGMAVRKFFSTMNAIFTVVFEFHTNPVKEVLVVEFWAVDSSDELT